MPIKTRNLTKFPIERLCFDLKLEVFEQLAARGVIELLKVNQGFEWMISSRPSIVFGHHVHAIQFGFDPEGIEAINLKKLNSVSLEVSLDVIRHFPFIKNIRSCDQLRMGNDYGSPINKDHAAFLKQLDAVNSLYLLDCSPVRLELLSHLAMKLKRYAGLPSFLQKALSIKDVVGHFIETQLNECEIVEFDCDDDDGLQFYYNAFIKTNSKYVGISCCHGDLRIAAIQRIVSHGIPSKNPAAIVRICHDFQGAMKTTIVVFLKGYPEMKQINGKNRQPFVALANERWKGSGCCGLTMKTRCLCFRRNINATRDCIYMLSLDEFLAFYIKPDEVVDH